MVALTSARLLEGGLGIFDCLIFDFLVRDSDFKSIPGEHVSNFLVADIFWDL
jgi:hypothetical protein